MNNKHNLSHRHHFIPRFYLKAWHDGQEGFWLYGRSATGHLFLRRRPAKSIAYIDDLYSLRPEGVLPLPESNADRLERCFFSPLDRLASIVHKKLITDGVNALSMEDRCTWALFLNSLMERTPSRIKELESGIQTGETIELFRHKWPLSELPDKIDWDAIKRNAILSTLIEFIVDEPFVEYVSKMVWQTVDFPEGPDHFLTSDSPLIVNGGQSSTPVLVMSIALSPQRLLIMHKNDSEFDGDFAAKLAHLYSALVAAQAEKHLISSRQLVDSNYIKYTRVANELLGKGSF